MQVAIGNKAVAKLHLCFLNILMIIHKNAIKNTVSINRIVYIGDIITKKLENEIIQKNLLFNKRNTINIQIATLGNDAGMIGAANL